MAAYDVERQIISTNRATVRLSELQRAVDLSPNGEVTITYRDDQRRVTVTVTHVGEERSVRYMCTLLPPERCIGFSITNVGMLASVINSSAEFLAFDCRRSLPRPVTVDAVFRKSSAAHDNLLKLMIADTNLYDTPNSAHVIAKSKLHLFASERIASGALFCFLRQDRAEGLDEGFLLSSRSTGNVFTIPRILARKLQVLYNKDIRSRVVSLSCIPRPLLWLLRCNFETGLEEKSEFFRDLMLESAAFIFRVLEWLPYFWVEEVAVLGCKILGHKLNGDLEYGFETVATSLGM